MDILAVHVGAGLGQRLTCRYEPAGHTYNFGVLECTRQEPIRRGALSHGDPNAGPINFLGCLQRQAWTTDIAVIDLHEHVAKRDILTPRRIARGEPDVPLILVEALVITGRIFVRDQSNRDIKLCSECAREVNGHTAELAVRSARHENRVGGYQGGTKLAFGCELRDI